MENATDIIPVLTEVKGFHVVLHESRETRPGSNKTWDTYTVTGGRRCRTIDGELFEWLFTPHNSQGIYDGYCPDGHYFATYLTFNEMLNAQIRHGMTRRAGFEYAYRRVWNVEWAEMRAAGGETPTACPKCAEANGARSETKAA